MVKLPTKEELEQLYHEKGHDALMWYAWRNALRALPALMELPTGRWRNYSLVQAYKVGRLSLVLAQWEKASSDVPNILIADEYEYEEELLSSSYPEGIMYDPDVAAAWAEDAEEAIANYVYATAVAQYAALIATYDMLPDTFSDDSFCTSSMLAARADYDFILTINEPASAYWLSQPLWPKSIDDQEIYLDRVHTWLQELGLGFLSDDLRDLLEGRPLNNHVENYLKDISDADLSNPEALHRIILGDESGQIHAVRTLLLGLGGAGKSSLADRLQGKPIEQIKTATPGIEYQNHQPLDLQKPSRNPTQSKKTSASTSGILAAKPSSTAYTAPSSTKTASTYWS